MTQMITEVVWEPMPGKIVVEVDKNEITRGGLILLRDPTNSRIGRVKAIYEPFNLHLDKPDEMTEAYVKVGDIVVFGRHSGVEVTVERTTVIILKEAELLTKVRVDEIDQRSEGQPHTQHIISG